MKRNRWLLGVVLSLVLGLMLSMTAFAQDGDLTLSSVVAVETGEDVVMSSPHGTIFPDPNMYDAKFYNGSNITLKFNMRSFGVATETYEIFIYKGDKADPNMLMARNSNNFQTEKGSYDIEYTWNTTSTTQYTPGTYTVVCTSYYNSGESPSAISNTEDCHVILEDNKLLLHRQFVDRLYETILGRKADEAGRNDWSSKLYAGTETGASIVKKFLGSQEFLGRDTTDEEYIEVLYRAMFDRDADPAGLEGWKEYLTSGFSRDYVLKGFVGSQEFIKLCNDYAIIRGDITLTESRDQNVGVTQFVGRMYNIVLERKPEAAGMNDWTNQLLTKASTPKQVAFGFVFSNEVKVKDLNNTQYVTMLYRAFMGREPDAPGLNDWVGKLDKNAATREQVFNGFADSNEFKVIVSSYGL